MTAAITTVDDESMPLEATTASPGVPESFLIDPDGLVVAKIVGGVRTQDLEALLARARNNTIKHGD